MSDTTQVYLITGFLGSGKTTFLNRIIDRFPSDLKLTLLVNEFGEIGVDGTLVEGDDIEMMEISKGSIFCVCVKTDFIKGLYELSTKVHPDILLIESTGVANPSDLKKDLGLPIFNNRFLFREQFCVIDALHFLDAYEVYASLEKQIASSSVFIINKTDLASAERIDDTKAVIRRFNPDPLFFETAYADIPLERFFTFSAHQGDAEPESDSPPTSLPVKSPAELDAFIDELLDSPDLEMTPPDLLVSAACQWSGNDLDEIRQMATVLPAGLVRAKGFVAQDGKIWLFNFVMGDWSLSDPQLPAERILHPNTIVFIGPPVVIEKVMKVVSGDQWIHLGLHQAYTP